MKLHLSEYQAYHVVSEFMYEMNVLNGRAQRATRTISSKRDVMQNRNSEEFLEKIVTSRRINHAGVPRWVKDDGGESVQCKYANLPGIDMNEDQERLCSWPDQPVDIYEYVKK